MKILHKQVSGIKVWFLFLAIIATLIVMSVLLESPRVIGKFNLSKQTGTYEITKGTIKIDGITFKVDVADTESEWKQGLSGTNSLAPLTGMLFVFDDNSQHGIWMKDMKYPIDVLWISENYRIVNIKKNMTPESYPEVFQNSKPARYVLELPAGSIDEYSFNGLSFIQIDTLSR
jgi:uncharacterized protein